MISKHSEISYDRMKHIAEKALDWIVDDTLSTAEHYNTLNEYLRIDDDELEQLGFGYLIPKENKEEE